MRCIVVSREIIFDGIVNYVQKWKSIDKFFFDKWFFGNTLAVLFSGRVIRNISCSECFLFSFLTIFFNIVTVWELILKFLLLELCIRATLDE